MNEGPPSHLKAHHYVLVRRLEIDPRVLTRRLHDHLLEVCPDCRREWARLEPQQPALRRSLAEAGWTRRRTPTDPAAACSPPDASPRLVSAFSDEARRLDAAARHLAADRRRARRELRDLLAVAPEHRRQRIETARTRFRSRGLAELLLEECRRGVDADPAGAEELAALVPVVLHWMPAAGDAAWPLALAARARACAADARRAAGDLAEAARRFASLRGDLASQPLNDAAAAAEIAALEAALRVDQGRREEAAALLDRAVLLLRHAGEPADLARVLLQRADLHRDGGDAARALDGLREAAALLDPAALHDPATLLDPNTEPALHRRTVDRRVRCLCALDRPAEAEALLDAHLDAWEACDDPWVNVSLRELHGHILLGLGRYAEADEAFASYRDGALLLERHRDAAAACLDQAAVRLAGGDRAGLPQLALELRSLLRSHRLPRAERGTVARLARAAAAGGLTPALLGALRARLLGA